MEKFESQMQVNVLQFKIMGTPNAFLMQESIPKQGNRITPADISSAIKFIGTPNSSLMHESISSKPAPLKNQGIKSAIIFLLMETPSFSCASSQLTRKRETVT